MIPPDISFCANVTNPQLYGCSVSANQMLDGYSMLAMGDYGDFISTYLWKILIIVPITWGIVHYGLIWYGAYLDEQAEERRQAKRMKDLPGTYR
jgi:hypothetical protein